VYRARNDAGDGTRGVLPSDEITADSSEREGDDWLFTLRGDVVARITIDDIASIVRARE
jgi:hypothetical protein